MSQRHKQTNPNCLRLSCSQPLGLAVSSISKSSTCNGRYIYIHVFSKEKERRSKGISYIVILCRAEIVGIFLPIRPDIKNSVVNLDGLWSSIQTDSTYEIIVGSTPIHTGGRQGATQCHPCVCIIHPSI